MIRIRTGSSWRHDPRLRAALTRTGGRVRAAAARAVVDALAVEVDGIDLAAGRAEGPLLPALEALLRAVARVVAGAPHATVSLPDGELEIVIRRRGASALLTIVALSRPSRVLASEVEVDVEDLAAAALDASATFCRELAEVIPEGADRESRRLRAAARDLRRAESTPPRRTRGAPPARAPRPTRAPGRFACVLELSDDDGLIEAYEGGRPDLGSLLAPGRLSLRAADGGEILALPGLPFLALRDLGAAADGLLGAVRRGEASFEIPLAHGRGAAAPALALDLAAGTVAAPGGGAVPCAPLELARAFAEAAVELGRTARARNPRQAENAYLAELETAAAARIAQIDELAEGDRAGPGGAAPVRAPPAQRLPQRALGPGRLRRLAFRRTFSVDAGAPAGAGLLPAGGLVVVAGAAEVIAVERATGAVRWRAPGCELAAAVPGAIVVVREGVLSALAPRSGRTLWSRPSPGGAPTSAVALARGPLVVVERGALTGLDPGSGRTLWRVEPPGASRLEVAAFGGIAAAGADTGFVYGIDAAGRVAWRVRAPGPIARAPSAAGRACLAMAEADPGAALLAIDPGTGTRRWEARLDLVPSGPPLPWGRRLVVGGTIGGDPAVCALERTGAPAWIVAPPLLAGAPALAPAGALLVARDPRGAVVALGRDGASRWSRPAPPGHLLGTAPPAVARATVVVPAADGLAALDARTGEIVGAIPGAAPSRLAVDAGLGVVAMDADGVASGWRLATHLSVL
jgi:outer membrane protein assembly factor BamB